MEGDEVAREGARAAHVGHRRSPRGLELLEIERVECAAFGGGEQEGSPALPLFARREGSLMALRVALVAIDERPTDGGSASGSAWSLQVAHDDDALPVRSGLEGDRVGEAGDRAEPGADAMAGQEGDGIERAAIVEAVAERGGEVAEGRALVGGDDPDADAALVVVDGLDGDAPRTPYLMMLEPSSETAMASSVAARRSKPSAAARSRAARRAAKVSTT